MTDSKSFQLDKKQLLRDVPMLAKPVAGALIDWINQLDANADGKPEIGVYGPLLVKAMPFVIELSKHIDWKKLLSELVLRYATDKLAAGKATDELIATVSGSGKVEGSVT